MGEGVSSEDALYLTGGEANTLSHTTDTSTQVLFKTKGASIFGGFLCPIPETGGGGISRTLEGLGFKDKGLWITSRFQDALEVAPTVGVPGLVDGEAK